MAPASSALPAYLLTDSPYAAHNSAVLIGLTFSVIGMYLLARRLTGNLPASLVAAVLFAFCPFLFARTAHIQLMMTAPFPFVLLAFHVFADDTTVKRAIVLGVSIAVQALFCAYYGVLVGLIVGLGILLFAVLRGVWRQPRWWYLSALAAAVAVLIVLPFFLPYIRLQDETGWGRTLNDSRRYSADWRAYFASSATAHRWMLPLLGHWKEVLFPGFTALDPRSVRRCRVFVAPRSEHEIRAPRRSGVTSRCSISSCWCSRCGVRSDRGPASTRCCFTPSRYSHCCAPRRGSASR